MGPVADPSLRVREIEAAAILAAAASVAVVAALAFATTIAHPFAIGFLVVAAAVAGLQAVEFAPNLHYDSADPVIVLAAVVGGPLGGAAAGVGSALICRCGRAETRVGYASTRALQGTAAGAAVAALGLHHATTSSALASGAVAEGAGTIVVFAITGYLALRGVVQLDHRIVLTNLFDPAIGTPLVAGLALAHARAGAGPLVLLLVPALAAATGVRIVRERWRLRHAESEARARRDPLTGAYNRRWFDDAVESEVARGGTAGLVLLDLDHFKAVNDEHGHLAGDAVLVEVVRRLSARVRAGDGVIRWGGEEFAVFLRALGDGADLAARAEDLRSAIGDAPFPFDGEEIDVTASAGAATLVTDGDALVRAADAALYDAKRAGRNRAVLV